MNTASGQPDPDPARQTLTVSQLNRAVASLLGAGLPVVRVEGELSNVTRAASGHWYFSLKDATAQVRCVMFRGRAQQTGFVPREGDRVEVRALPSIYEARGDFQLNVEAMRRAGAGDLFARFLALRERLQREGLFDPARKRALPASPRVVAVVTSPQAAALRDVLTTLRRRSPATAVIVYPTPVQGAEAPPAIVAALARVADRREAEVVLLVRGGGSIEDLWAFNDERVARAVAACPLPIVVGVGHETDFTIADFVADLRAPTPTAAAELVCPERREQLLAVAGLAQRLHRALSRTMDRVSQRLDLAVRLLRPPSALWRDRSQRIAGLTASLRAAAGAQQLRRRARLDRAASRLQRPRTELQGQRLESLAARLRLSTVQAVSRRTGRLDSLAGALDLVSPQAVLDRGYAIVSDLSGRVLSDPAQVLAGDGLSIRLARGAIGATVTGRLEASAPPASPV
jgi:exodeoxyribonuclease VII large subunit